MKKNEQHINYDLQVKFLLGECNALEKERVEAWISADPVNREEFKKLETIWEESRKISRQSTVDTDAAWEKFKQLTEEKDRGASKAKVVSLQSSQKRWLFAAASVVIFLGIGMLYKWIMKPVGPVPVQIAMVKIESSGETLRDTLPDGTVITLNKNSMIEFPADFVDSVRKVSMEGEVFFEVAKNAAKPFVVQAPEATIRVLGTSFNVKSRQGKISVVVETGVVEVSRKGKKVELVSGKKVTINEADTVLQPESISDSLYRYFRSKEFICDNTKLSDLASVLAEAYGVTITIEKPDIANMRISTTFSDESLDNILFIIEQTMGVNTIRNGESILIR